MITSFGGGITADGAEAVFFLWGTFAPPLVRNGDDGNFSSVCFIKSLHSVWAFIYYIYSPGGVKRKSFSKKKKARRLPFPAEIRRFRQNTTLKYSLTFYPLFFNMNRKKKTVKNKIANKKSQL